MIGTVRVWKMIKIKNLYSEQYRKPYLFMRKFFLDELLKTKGNVMIVEAGIDDIDGKEQEYYIVKIYRGVK